KWRAAAAGALGGALFYTYVYYAIGWSAAIALLAVYCIFRVPRRLKLALLSLGVTVLLSIPFLLWTREAKKSGGYEHRSARLGMTYSHLPSSTGLQYTAWYLLLVVVVIAAWLRWRSRLSGLPEEIRRRAEAMALLLSCAAVGGLAGMNMQLVTGFNVQAEKHFTHMIVQPAVMILALIMLLTFFRRSAARESSRAAMMLFIALWVAGAGVQVIAGVNSAEVHRIPPAEAALFRWLKSNTSPDDVVATTSVPLSTELPVFTHNYTLVVNGTRTSGTDDEVLDRFLLANALAGTPSSTLVEVLTPPPSSAIHQPGDPAVRYPVSFLFEHSPYRVDNLLQPSLTPAAASAVLSRYQHLDLNRQLHRFRVNYVYTLAGQHLAEVAGWQAQKVLQTTEGALWRLTPNA
ncbi:MAG TPA: hypothetical protein VGR96_04235, partial [Acidobacteriaceae bacterium]|nr:hypothetical protein [Acidobacteriaceae bacterium]